MREAARRRARASPSSTRETPDLVVLDFIMPGLSGAEVASRILRQAPRPADPVRVRLQRDRGGQAASRPTRRCSPSRSAPTRSRRRCAGALAATGLNAKRRVRALSRRWCVAWPVRCCSLLAAAAQPRPAAASQPARPPAARSIFERDWVLMNWALKFYDRDRDILLEPGEAAGGGAGVPEDRRRRWRRAGHAAGISRGAGVHPRALLSEGPVRRSTGSRRRAR